MRARPKGSRTRREKGPGSLDKLMKKNHLPSPGRPVSGLLDGREIHWSTVILGLCNEWSNLNPTQHGVEGRSEKRHSNPVSLTECIPFQHPMQRQRQQVQAHFSSYSTSYGGKSFPQGLLKRMMTFFHVIIDHATQDHL